MTRNSSTAAAAAVEVAADEFLWNFREKKKKNKIDKRRGV